MSFSNFKDETIFRSAARRYLRREEEINPETGRRWPTIYSLLGLTDVRSVDDWFLKGQVIVQEEPHRQYTGWKIGGGCFSDTQEPLAKYLHDPRLEFQGKCLHEITPGKCSQKMRFDIDIKSDQISDEIEREAAASRLIEKIIEVVPEFLRQFCNDFNPKWIICTSNGKLPDGKMKTSYHVILPEYYFRSNEACQRIYDEVISRCLDGDKDYLDPGPLSGPLRMLHCHKYGDHRVKVLIKEKVFGNVHYKFDESLIFGGGKELYRFSQLLKHTLISQVVGCEYIDVPYEEKTKVYAEITDTNIAEARRVLEEKYPEMGFRVDTRDGKMFYAAHTPGLECLICKRLHDGSEHNFISQFQDGGVALMCHRNVDESKKKKIKKTTIKLIEGNVSIYISEAAYEACSPIPATSTGRTAPSADFMAQWEDESRIEAERDLEEARQRKLEEEQDKEIFDVKVKEFEESHYVNLSMITEDLQHGYKVLNYAFVNREQYRAGLSGPLGNLNGRVTAPFWVEASDTKSLDMIYRTSKPKCDDICLVCGQHPAVDTKFVLSIERGVILFCDKGGSMLLGESASESQNNTPTCSSAPSPATSGVSTPSSPYSYERVPSEVIAVQLGMQPRNGGRSNTPTIFPTREWVNDNGVLKMPMSDCSPIYFADEDPADLSFHLPQYNPRETFYWSHFIKWFKRLKITLLGDFDTVQTFPGKKAAEAIAIELSKVCRLFIGDGHYAYIKKNRKAPFKFIKLKESDFKSFKVKIYHNVNGKPRVGNMTIFDFMINCPCIVSDETVTELYHSDLVGKKNPNVFNTFAGFEAELIEYNFTEETLPPELREFLGFIRGVHASGNDLYFKYILSAMAKPITELMKTGKIVHLAGGQGTGKSLLMEFLMSYLYGDINSYKYDTASSINLRFNQELNGKFFVYVDEFSDGGNQSRAAILAKMKSWATSNKISSEGKGRDQEQEENHLNWWACWNIGADTDISKVLPLEGDDRRNAMFHTSDALVKLAPQVKKDWIERFKKSCFNSKFANLLYSWFRSQHFYDNYYMDISGDPPMTELKTMAIRNSKNSADVFAEDIIEGSVVLTSAMVSKNVYKDGAKELNGGVYLSMPDLYVLYSSWCKTNGYKNPFGREVFTKNFSNAIKAPPLGAKGISTVAHRFGNSTHRSIVIRPEFRSTIMVARAYKVAPVTLDEFIGGITIGAASSSSGEEFERTDAGITPTEEFC